MLELLAVLVRDAEELCQFNLFLWPSILFIKIFNNTCTEFTNYIIIPMVFKSINPKNGKLLKTYDCITNKDLHEKLEKSLKCFKYMKN